MVHKELTESGFKSKKCPPKKPATTKRRGRGPSGGLRASEPRPDNGLRDSVWRGRAGSYWAGLSDGVAVHY
jgi:hypothetical protein